MKDYKQVMKTGLILIAFSAVLYFIIYLIFGDGHHLIIVIAEELAYMPIYVFITAVIAERLLTQKEKMEMSRKMNALVGTFFTEVGYEMIKITTGFDKNFSKIRDQLIFEENWDRKKALDIRRRVESYNYLPGEGVEELYVIKELLISRKDLMLELMSNAILIEKDEFSELLLAVNHILEEFRTRGEISTFTKPDIIHLHMDIERAYRHLIIGWVTYMIHLEKEYPYLYQLAVRINPFKNQEVV